MPSYFYHIILEFLPGIPSVSSQTCSSHTSSSLDPSSPTFKAIRESVRPFRRRRPKAGKQDRNEGFRQPNSASGEGHRVENQVTGHNNQCPSSTGTTFNFNNIIPQYSHSNFSAYQQQQQQQQQQQIREQEHSTSLPELSGQLAATSLSDLSDTSASPPVNDKRLDRISIEGIDMVSEQEEHQRREQNLNQHDKRSGNVSNDEITKGIGSNVIGGLATKGKYLPLDRQVTESVWGIVHLFRDAEESPALCEGDEDPSFLKGSSVARNSRPPNATTAAAVSGAGAGKHHHGSYAGGNVWKEELGSAAPALDDCTTLCILAVPSYLSPSDFLGFVGEPTRDDVSHFRMIKTARANRYMVLMKFRSGRKAKEWQRAWNGKVFNSMEPETCHVVFVKNVEIQFGTTGMENRFPDMKNDPFTFSEAQSGSLASSSRSTKPLAPPTPSLVELPTCPVCLERMDETSGLLTIICQHVFHCTCLQKWKGSGCPVCRYTQDDLVKRSNTFAFDEGPTECSVCHSEINLWLCLICGNIGCGRYDGAHAFAHYKETSHSFAMDLASQRVWDYIGDGYVHRIIQNKSDGKLVELPAADNSALDPPDWTDAVPREKLENMSVEYTHLLTSQLDSQRTYFEEQVERAADKASQASAAAITAQEVAEKVTSRLTELQSQYENLVEESIPSLERDKARAERRAEKFETMTRNMEKQWREEKTMNTSLMERVEFLNAEVDKLKTANEDLSEQNRDLTFFISGTERLKNQSEDVVEGTVSVPEAEASGRGKRKKGKRKAKG